MKEHTNQFKTQVKELGRQFKFQVIYGNTILEEELYGVTPHYEGSILKSTMKQIDIDTTVNIPYMTKIQFKMALLVNNAWEWLDFGYYYVYKSEKQEDRGTYKLVCYDKLINAMKTYEGIEAEFPMTLREYLQEICDKLDIDFGSANDDFANYNIEIPEDRYTGLQEYTYRDVLDEIAQATGSMICLNSDDELIVKYINEGIDNYNTVEGTSFELDDASGGLGSSITQLEGNTTQDGTPTPDNPVEIKTVSGDNEVVVQNKNLFDMTFYNYGGLITNPLYNSTRLFTVHGIRVKANTEYTVSTNLDTTQFKYGVWLATQDFPLYNTAQRYFDSGWNWTSKRTVTATQGGYLGIIISTYNGNDSLTPSDIEGVTWQVEEGSTATTYIAHSENTYNINFGYSNPIPDTYQEVEYIEANGTQYIDTGFKPCMNRTRIVCDMIPTNDGDNAFFGSRGTFYMFYKVSGNYFWPISQATTVSGTMTVGNKYHIDWDKGRFIATGEDGVYQVKTTSNNTQDNTSMYLFTFNPVDNRKANAKLYSFKIYYDDILVREFVPCYRKSDSVIGLYDTVGGTFYTNIGTGTFGKGTDKNTQSIELCKIGNYIDTLFKAETGNPTYDSLDDTTKASLTLGNWYIEKNISKVVLNGSEANWGYYTATAKPVFYLICEDNDINYKIESGLTCYSNYYLGKGQVNSFDDVYNLGNNVIAFRTSYTRLVIRNDSITTMANFKTWLSNNPTTVYYVLATPTYETITNENLIQQLNNIQDIQLIENLCHVDWVGSESPTMTLKYYQGRTLEEINEEYLKDVNVDFGEKYGPVNSIVLSRSGESDNVYIQDEDSIEENGLCELKIVDNQLMNFNDRSDYLEDLLDKLDGLEYYINDYVSTGILYLDLGDRYYVNVGENRYSCIMFNDEIEITGGMKEIIHAEALKETKTDYTKADKTDRRIDQAYIIVDKQNGTINSLISKTNELDLKTDSNYNELVTKFDNYAPTSDIVQLRTELEQVTTDTYTKTEINTMLIDGSVQKVSTTAGTFDSNGLTIEKTGAKTKGNFNESGIKVIDATSGSAQELLFAGYDTTLNETIVRTKNITVEKYLTLKDVVRQEKYINPVLGGKGIGTFIL